MNDRFSIGGFNATRPLDARTVSLTLHSIGDNSQKFNINEVLVMDKVPANDAQPNILNEICQQHTHLNEINFPHLDSNEVCLLIGNDNFDLINASLTIKGEDNVPRAKKTALGWTIAGPNAVTASHTSFRAATTTSCNEDDNITELLSKQSIPITTERQPSNFFQRLINSTPPGR